MYGCTSKVPANAALQPLADSNVIDLDNYFSELTTRMSATWKSARKHKNLTRKTEAFS